MSYNISALEGRNSGRDWPLIVQAVPCNTCGAKEGEPCKNSGTSNPMLAHVGAPRIDWHAERKQLAAHLWYAGREEGVPEKDIASLIAGQKPSTPGGEPSDTVDANVATEGDSETDVPKVAPSVESETLGDA